MNNVLIVEDSKTLLRSITVSLKSNAPHLNLLLSENGEDTINILAKEQVSVLVADFYMPKVDGLELLSYMSRHHPAIPCIVMTAFSSPEVMEIMHDLGVHSFLEKPFAMEELVKAVTDANGQNNQGKPAKHLSIKAFLRLLEEEQRSCTLETTDQKGLKGYFDLVDGRLYDARCGNLHGEEAAISILRWKKVSFDLQDLPTEDIKARIHSSLKSLFSKTGSRQQERGGGDEPKEAGDKNLKEILFQAIRNAESGNIKQARQSLARILKTNPKNRKAWLWFARTSDNFKTINIALKNASTIAPEDSEIAGEIEKSTSAVTSGCEELSRIKHCHFCWAPVRQEHKICHYCNAHLEIDEDFFHLKFFASRNDPNFKLILDSFQRFTKATISDRNNAQAHFCLAIAHINLDQWDEALEELKNAQKIAPENKSYRKQLEILADFMVDLGSFCTQNPPPEEIAAIPAKPGIKDKMIMVVEDSNTTRTIIMKMLKKEGYQVTEAKDGFEALSKFREQAPDLVLLDIIMPGMDGYQTLAALKRKHDLEDIPVIMLTAKDSLIDKLKGKMSGSTEYLTKPFNALELIKKIRNHLK
jgi:twitching motility two-component system response regulator PilG